MLLEHQLERVAVEIAHFLVSTGGHAGSAWDGYTGEPLVALDRNSDELVEYVRRDDGEARLRLFNIHEVDPDPSTIVFHPEIVLESKRRAMASQELDNDTSEQQSLVFRKEFKDAESELRAVEAGFSLENTATVEAGGEASQFTVTQEFKTTVSSAWKDETGKTKEETTGGEFPLIAAPYTYVKGQLEWDEQTRQRRIECYGTYDFGIEMGRRRWIKRGTRRRWEWVSGSPVSWGSLEHLLAVAEKRGSVHHAGYRHYAGRSVSADDLAPIREARRQHIDRLTPPFKGAVNIGVRLLEQRPARG